MSGAGTPPAGTTTGTTTPPANAVTVGSLTGTQPAQSTSSLPYGSFTVPGPFVVTQGCWGDSAAQSVATAGPDGFKVTASSHNKSGGVAAYPSIYHGSWPSAQYQTGTVWPRAIKAISYWHATAHTSGPPTKGDIAWDIWLGTSSTTHDALELMIWLWGNVDPIGSKVATISSSGQSWDVWYGNSTGTPTVSYLATAQPGSVDDLDLAALLDDAIARGYAKASQYLTSVQFGSEIWIGGTGFTLSAYQEVVG